MNKFSKLMAWLVAQGHAKQVAHAVVKIAEAVGPLDFGASGPELWAKCYRSVSPNAKRGLGERRIAVLKDARRWWNESTNAEKAEAERKKAEKVASVFTLEQLRALVSVMELCNLKTVEMNTARVFFSAFGVNQ